MIAFQPEEAQNALAESVHAFAQRYLHDNAREVEEKRGLPPQVLQEAVSLGLTILSLPEALGGTGLDLVTQAIAYEALGWGDLGSSQALLGAYTGHHLLAALAAQTSTPDRLGDLAETSVCWVAPTWGERPQADGSLVWQRDAGGVVLSGESAITLGAQHATHLLVAAEGQGGAAILAVPAAASGVHFRPHALALGMLAAGVGSVRFEEVRLEEADLLAVGETAQTAIRRALTTLAIEQGALEVGACRAATEYTVAYTAQRRAFQQVIAAFQGVSFVAADMAIETEAARNLIWKAAVQGEKGEDAFPTAAMALAHAHQAVRFVTSNAVQLLGGHGFVQDHPVEKWMRDAEAQVLLFGRELELQSVLGDALWQAGAKDGTAGFQLAEKA